MPFESRGAEVGATLSHPHGQIYAFNHLPPQMERRVAALVEGRTRTGTCVTCGVVARPADERPSHPRGCPLDGRRSVRAALAVRGPCSGGPPRAAPPGGPSPDEARSLARALHFVVERYNGLFGFELPYMMIVWKRRPAPTTGTWRSSSTRPIDRRS